MSHARYLVALIAVLNAGGLLADALLPATARQHLLNPAWPPHAKFHNAQTMLLGLLNGALALVLLFEDAPSRSTFVIATLMASAYFLAMAAAPMFPGTAWCDPEFDPTPPLPRLRPQQKLAYAVCAAAAVALGWGLFE